MAIRIVRWWIVVGVVAVVDVGAVRIWIGDYISLDTGRESPSSSSR